MTGKTAKAGPQFDARFQAEFRDLVLWRRDVRRFRDVPVDRQLVDSLIEIASHAPSVGNCQPWRFVHVESAKPRRSVKNSFKRANAEALKGYDGARRQLYAELKLEGLDKAPVQIAVFADSTVDDGHGLGRLTMPETVQYSVVGAIHTLWLSARAHGLGLGWISILEPEFVTQELQAPDSWTFVAYLCIGWPVEDHLDPELVRHGWQERVDLNKISFRR